MYDIIYADPPWEYSNKRNCDPKYGGITYETMEDQKIKELNIAGLANKDCALFLWGTWPKLPSCLDVMKTWGFRYTTCAFVWLKLNPKSPGIYSGLGSWTNSNTEFCLLGKRGSPKREAKNVKQVLTSTYGFSPWELDTGFTELGETEVIVAHRGRHSAKPPEVRERIVQLIGDKPRIELFAREPCPGWTSIGKELGTCLT
jgi:N6-adenosine-specific RNA methylase IME4